MFTSPEFSFPILENSYEVVERLQSQDTITGCYRIYMNNPVHPDKSCNPVYYPWMAAAMINALPRITEAITIASATL
jgi:hypothetical protein